MTVLNVPNYIYYTGGGGVTSFPFPYKAYDEANIKVYKITSIGTVLQTSGYSLSYTNLQNGCNVIFNTAPASGTTVYIERELDEEQTTDIPTGGAFLESVVEGMADFCTMLLQQLSWKIRRSVKTPLSSSIVDLELPSAEDGKILGWDSVGKIVNLSGTSNANITPYMLGVLSGVSSSSQLSDEAGTSSFTDIQTEIAPYSATGDILYRNAAGHIVPLSIGGSSQQLRSTGTIPVWYTDTITQGIVQIVNFQTGAGVSGSTPIPDDDSIPQNTEGTEFLTLAITPKATTNKLLIDVVLNYQTNSGDIPIIALFQDAGVSAIAAVRSGADHNTYPRVISFKHYMTAGTVASTTFKVRCGGPASAVITLNGDSGARKLGGVIASSITITEIQP